MTTALARLRRPGTYHRVTSLLLSRADGDLTLTLHLEPGDAGPAIVACFLGVRDLRFLGESVDLASRVMLSIADMRSDGWEDVAYRVQDLEGDFISFYCRAFETDADGVRR